jgi:hypothetical protein
VVVCDYTSYAIVVRRWRAGIPFERRYEQEPLMYRTAPFLSRVVVSASCGLSLFFWPAERDVVAQDQKGGKAPLQAKSLLEGAWRLVTSKDPASGQARRLPDGVEMTKLIVGGRYVWMVVRDGKAIAGAGGNYTVDGDSYTESVSYVLNNDQRMADAMVGKSFKFAWKIENGKWHHKGTMKFENGQQFVDELWERIR